MECMLLAAARVGLSPGLLVESIAGHDYMLEELQESPAPWADGLQAAAARLADEIQCMPCKDAALTSQVCIHPHLSSFGTFLKQFCSKRFSKPLAVDVTF